MSKSITFENLPLAVSEIYAKLENLEALLKSSQIQTPQHTQLDELLNVEAAAKFLHLKSSTIYSKVHNGTLSSMKRGKRLLFSRVDLLAYAKAGKRKSNDEIRLEADKYIQSKKGVYNV